MNFHETVLNGDLADIYERRRERQRNHEQGRRNPASAMVMNMEGRLLEAMALANRNLSNLPNPSTSAFVESQAGQARLLGGNARSLDLDSMDYEDLYRMFPSHAPRGTAPQVIEDCSSVYLYNSSTSPDTQSCTICLLDFESNQEIRLLPCLHAYHRACADEWLRNNRSCPVCKTDIQTLAAEIPRLVGKTISASWIRVEASAERAGTVARAASGPWPVARAAAVASAAVPSSALQYHAVEATAAAAAASGGDLRLAGAGRPLGGPPLTLSTVAHPLGMAALRRGGEKRRAATLVRADGPGPSRCSAARSARMVLARGGSGGLCGTVWHSRYSEHLQDDTVPP